MDQNMKKYPFFNKKTWQIIGVLVVLLLAAALLRHGTVNSVQAVPAYVAEVYFDGEYRIADGSWQPIVKGAHIPATRGDVTLRGTFHILEPDGTYGGVYTDELPIAFYINHINLTFYDGVNEPFVVDMEDPQYGNSLCGVDWTGYTLDAESDGTIEILVHNPHRYGNENAIDEMLAGLALWTPINFEKSVLETGDSQRDMGSLLMIISLALVGTALFSTLIHIKNSKIIWLLGIVIFFAGTYLSYSADGISFRSNSIVSNTTILGCAMMFYMMFLSIAIVHLLKNTKPVGVITVTALGAVNGLFFLLPMVTAKVLFYDTWFYWILAQGVANLVLLGCLVKEFCAIKDKMRWLYMGLVLPLVSFGVDAGMTAVGIWEGGLTSAYVFIIFFIAAMVAVLKIIPQSINTLAKAKELETEKIMLNAQLTESRVSTMMSQIRPHFIYNTLGSIEQLCLIDPQKAGELVHNFAKYLRGNFGELDNPKPIRMSQEMEHVRHYVSIENVRFPDMTFTFEMNSVDFLIPALTIQPIVENAIKHGLMKLPKGGTIRVESYETDTHYCVSVVDDGMGFDPGELLEDRKRVGIRNIRGRLRAMVNGELQIESAPGAGTRVLITIPKEVRK